MRPDVELLADGLADPRGATGVFLGRRWALCLGTTLLVALALINAARWREATASPTGPESVIQQPVPSDPFPSATRSDTTAPDPGDNPP